MRGRCGSGAAPPEAPNFEGTDPGAPVNPGGLAGRQQEPVANMTPSSPLSTGSFSSDPGGLGCECTEVGNGGTTRPTGPAQVQVSIPKPS